MNKRIKTGCLFGSFNPIHNGHLMVAEYMASQTDLDGVEFVVSPHSPFKDPDLMSDELHRLEMTRLALEDNPLLSVNDIEYGLGRPSYTIETLTALSIKHPEREYSLIMGSDNLAGMRKWRDWEKILDRYNCYVYLRPGAHPGDLIQHRGVEIFDVPSIHLSSTYIRDTLANGYSTKYLIPGKVRAYIEEHGLYSTNNP
ncbi:MAG: nicotinic acid mononucleotide adenylyltransferase [Bacteroidetes bacterium]|nr:MAG: nicotinic acid mononucleotide adenylyltransferase [Bacteroidota bacterium]